MQPLELVQTNVLFFTQYLHVPTRGIDIGL